MKQQDSFHPPLFPERETLGFLFGWGFVFSFVRLGLVFFPLQALQAPSSSSPEQGRSQLSGQGQQAVRRHQYVNNSPYYGKGSTIRVNHSQQQPNLSLQQQKKTPTRLDAVTCCYLLRAPALFLHPFLQRGGKRNQSSWFKRGKSRGATAGVLFPKYQECLDHMRHFQRGMGGTYSLWVTHSGKGWGFSQKPLRVHLSCHPGAVAYIPARMPEHEKRRLEGRRFFWLCFCWFFFKTKWDMAGGGGGKSSSCSGSQFPGGAAGQSSAATRGCTAKKGEAGSPGLPGEGGGRGRGGRGAYRGTGRARCPPSPS